MRRKAVKERNVNKGGLFKKSKKFLNKRQELIIQVKNLKAEYQKLSVELQPEIDSLQLRADELADKFRKLYQESQQAYSEGDGASAKALSVQGHTIQDQCEALNKEVNVRRNKLKNRKKRINDLYLKIRELEKESKKCREEAGKLRQTYVKKFEGSKVITNDKVEEFLDEFPQAIFKEVKGIEYVESLYWESKTGKIKAASRGMTVWDKNNKAVIKIGRQPDEEEETDKLQIFKEVITHEIGHIVYECFLADEQKAEWFAYYEEDSEKGKFISDYSLESEEEDFAESFRFFKLEPERLQNHDERRYNLIKEIMEEFKNEET